MIDDSIRARMPPGYEITVGPGWEWRMTEEWEDGPMSWGSHWPTMEQCIADAWRHHIAWANA